MVRSRSDLKKINPAGHSWYCSKRNPKVNLIDRNSKTLNGISPAVNILHHYSLYCIFLKSWSFNLINLFQSSEKAPKSPISFNDVSAVVRAKCARSRCVSGNKGSRSVTVNVARCTKTKDKNG